MSSPPSRPWLRRAFHAVAGSLLPAAALLLPQPLAISLLVTATVAILLWELLRLTQPRLHWLLQEPVHVLFKPREHDRVTAATYLVGATLLCFLLFPARVAGVAVLYTAWGDPLAATVGEKWGRRRPWGKSLEGSLGCLAGAAGAGLLVGTWLGGLDLLAVLAGAIVAAFVESLPLPVDDNLAVPVVAGAALSALVAVLQ
ncbi:MAG: hypothetical protein HY685_03730 [Chloroflexi bacterium]|nr:hypothetical protein [Chloroflexota bacterium]